MAKKSKETDQRKFIPAQTNEARENQLVALAMDLAEQQLRDGTASSQVITHFLKMGSTKDSIERDILTQQKELITAKTDNLKSSKRIEELYEEAIKAMRTYNGADDDKDIF